LVEREMKIDESKCVGCGQCVPYCPVGAISLADVKAIIDEDECVECGECQKAGVCPVNAHVRPAWTKPGSTQMPEEVPRVLRYWWSDPQGVFPWTGIGGRGTQEMKTNDVTGRFTDDVVGIGVEFGRPGIGSRLSDVEKASVRLAALGVSFEFDSPWTHIIDSETGKLKDPRFGKERVLSCIIECKAPMEKIAQIYKALMEVAKEIDTVFTLDIISKCREGRILVKPLLDEARIKVRINGKTNLGLGRPLIP